MGQVAGRRQSCVVGAQGGEAVTQVFDQTEKQGLRFTTHKQFTFLEVQHVGSS